MDVDLLKIYIIEIFDFIIGNCNDCLNNDNYEDTRKAAI